MTAPELSVCVATRNRPELLVRCLNSLTHLDGRRFEVLVIDDASEPAVEPAVRPLLDPSVAAVTRFVRHQVNTGYIVARNELARLAAATVLLYLDDDAELMDAGVLEGLDLITRDPTVGGIGFAQAGADGQRLPTFNQPAPVPHRCYAPTFYGYAHLVRKDVFLKLGGYREQFRSYGEESEFCKRLWNAGLAVVYLPDVVVRHVHSPTGRSELTRMRYGCRNSILGAMYNEPMLMAAATIPVRLYRYWRWRRVPCEYYGISDAGGMRWQLAEIVRNLPDAARHRSPLKLSIFRKLERLKREFPAYP
jgi:GT2 family glycosyltransferase